MADPVLPSGVLYLDSDAPAVHLRYPPPSYFYPGDKHVRRDGDAYCNLMLSLLPPGQAWPRSPDSVLARTICGLAYYYGHIDARAADLLEIESDPRKTVELLPDWERNFGLPDPCYTLPQTIAERQIALVRRMTYLGAQDRDYFYGLAEEKCFDIYIQEYAPWTFGISECGETDDGEPNHYWRWEIGAPQIRFFWKVKLRSASTCDVPVEDLICILNRYKPAQTQIVFDYKEIGWHQFSQAGAELEIKSERPLVGPGFQPRSGALRIFSERPVVEYILQHFFWPPSAALVFGSEAPSTKTITEVGSAALEIVGSAPTLTRTIAKQPASAALTIGSTAPTARIGRSIVVGSRLLEIVGVAPEVHKSSFMYQDSTYMLYQDGTRMLLQ